MDCLTLWEVKGRVFVREADVAIETPGDRTVQVELAKALAKNPDDRFQTAQEFSAAINAARAAWLTKGALV